MECLHCFSQHERHGTHRGTMRLRTMSAGILSAAAQLYKKNHIERLAIL